MKIKTSDLKNIIKQVVRESLETRSKSEATPPKQNSGQRFLKKLEEAGYKIVPKTAATDAAQNKAQTIQKDPNISEQGSVAEDPDKEEMMEFLRSKFGNEEGFEFDAEAAIYWFANHNHGGQSSNLYSVLSTSQFNPGPMSRGPEAGSLEELMYDELMSEFGGSGSVGDDDDDALADDTDDNELHPDIGVDYSDVADGEESDIDETAYKTQGPSLRTFKDSPQFPTAVNNPKTR